MKRKNANVDFDFDFSIFNRILMIFMKKILQKIEIKIIKIIVLSIFFFNLKNLYFK